MKRLWKPLFAIWLGLYGLARAQPQRRSEGSEHSWPYRVLTGDTDVLSVINGGILPGGETKYLAAAVACKSSDTRCNNPSTVYVRQCEKGLEVVGLDR